LRPRRRYLRLRLRHRRCRRHRRWVLRLRRRGRSRMLVPLLFHLDRRRQEQVVRLVEVKSSRGSVDGFIGEAGSVLLDSFIGETVDSFIGEAVCVLVVDSFIGLGWIVSHLVVFLQVGRLVGDEAKRDRPPCLLELFHDNLCAQNTRCFECFPYVCPEPVLVK
jgi:hypothetical protein